MTGAVLDRTFYDRDTTEVARDVLGKVIVRRTSQGDLCGVVVETEAYLTGDPASHAFRGRTDRNASMFGPPGHAYVYLSYGAHSMLNLVTGPPGCGEAVLIRALAPVAGLAVMRQYRAAPPSVPDARLLAGPGRLARAMAIDRSRFDGVDLTNRDGGLYLIDGPSPDAAEIAVSPRIGITKAADSPLRFYLAANPSVSRR